MTSLLDTLKSAAFDLGPDPALIIDADGRLAAVNEAAQGLFGHSLGLLGRGAFRAALPAGSALIALIDRAASSNTRVRERALRISLYGVPTFEADGAAAPLGDGSVLVLLSVRPNLAGDLGAADAAGLRAIVGLGQMLAHEIKNPLAGIRGAAQLLKTGARAEDAPLAQLIVDETDRVKRLVERMEAFSDDSLRDLAPINIHQVLERVRALAANGFGEGLTLRERYDPSLPPLIGDEDALIQIFLNLVKNAAEAAHARGDDLGEVTIRTAFRHGVRVRAAASDRGAGQPARGAPLEVRIADNGPGVPAHLREHLFQPFVSAKATGAGLGLALVAKLVAAHGGLIDFESEPGRTEFRVLLPIAAPEELPA
ncbi:nitrogen regulation protein NR(II) [Phenylobacterium sp.]|jgi:two-component system nitrogen regulation sensor histidine kinase GlnL|uniref:nitrogen regulation protein NR(II) n=1 Tax=Phenylobacterium sp. TaxID=1871053 RepID=UPI0037839F1D